MYEVYVGDVGTEVSLNCGVDISTATVRKILVQKPNTTAVVEWSAMADGANSIRYLTTTSDLDVAGTYLLQPYVELPGWSGKGETVELFVRPAFG